MLARRAQGLQEERGFAKAPKCYAFDLDNEKKKAHVTTLVAELGKLCKNDIDKKR